MIYQAGDIIGTNQLIEKDLEKSAPQRPYWKCKCLLCNQIRSIRTDGFKNKCRSCAAKNREKRPPILDDLTDRQLTYCWQLISGNTATDYFSGYAQGTSGNTLHQDIAVDYSLILETDVYGYKIGGSGRWNSKVKLYTYEFMKNFIQSIVSVFN